MKRLPLLLILTLFVCVSANAQLSSGTAYRLRGSAGVPPATCNSGPPADLWYNTATDVLSTCTAANTWTTLATAGGGITNSAGANVVTKSDGTNLVASKITDDGTTASITIPEVAPVAPDAATAEDGAGSVTNGVHRFKVTYVTAQGETEAGTASDPVTVTDNSVDGHISVLPTAGSGFVTSRKVYMTLAGGSSYFLVSNGTIANNDPGSSIVVNDSDAVLALSTAAPSTNTTANPVFSAASSAVSLNSGSVGMALTNFNFSSPEVPILTVDTKAGVGKIGNLTGVGTPTAHLLIDPEGEVEPNSSHGIFLIDETGNSIGMVNGDAITNVVNDRVFLGDAFGNGHGTLLSVDDGDDTEAITLTAPLAVNLTTPLIRINATVTPAATVGAQEINKSAGSVNFDTAATSLVVTNSLVTANSIIICTVATNDTAMKSVQCVAGGGIFTMFANAAASAETRVNFWVITPQ